MSHYSKALRVTILVLAFGTLLLSLLYYLKNNAGASLFGLAPNNFGDALNVVTAFAAMLSVALLAETLLAQAQVEKDKTNKELVQAAFTRYDRYIAGEGIKEQLADTHNYFTRFYYKDENKDVNLHGYDVYSNTNLKLHESIEDCFARYRQQSWFKVPYKEMRSEVFGKGIKGFVQQTLSYIQNLAEVEYGHAIRSHALVSAAVANTINELDTKTAKSYYTLFFSSMTSGEINSLLLASTLEDSHESKVLFDAIVDLDILNKYEYSRKKKQVFTFLSHFIVYCWETDILNYKSSTEEKNEKGRLAHDTEGYELEEIVGSSDHSTPV